MRRACMFALLLAGCAAPTAQLSPDVLSRLQREARVEIYDRENDVVIAKNREDVVRLRVESLLAQLDAMSVKAKRRKERLAKAPADRERAARFEKTAQARRGYLEAELRQEGASAALADGNVQAALARLEQTRQRQLVRTGRALAASMKPFDERLEQLEKHLRELERREQDKKSETEKAFESWKNAEGEYARATGDWDSGIWLD